MILVDTSVWVRHLQTPNAGLSRLLTDDEAGSHPFVIGEVACGNLRNRDRAIWDLQLLPQAEIADEIDVRHTLEANRLWGMGLGWVDLHVLTAAYLARWGILTADRAMLTAARRMGVPAQQA
jgi:predicted nucleic acid-binding protein